MSLQPIPVKFAENGNVIFLRGNIVARGLKNGSILRGNELEWRPEEDVLIVREDITWHSSRHAGGRPTKPGCTTAKIVWNWKVT